MQIETININEIVEYENNVKQHPQEQIEQIIQSIEQFGFNDPIAIDENNVIIEGHGRLYAVKRLGYTEVPVIRLTHLTDEEKRAYILVHNKLTMNSAFNNEMLNIELSELLENGIDMSLFDFELPEIKMPDNITNELNNDKQNEDVEPVDVTEHHRETTVNQYNLYDYDEHRVSGMYDMPTLEPVDHTPKKLQGFNYILNNPDYLAGVHFFLDDYQFERIWQRPHYYIEKLADFDCVLTPDFSLYLDMPIAMQVWNIYRSRLIGQIMQDYGITVIPTVSWSTEASYSFCFDGLPKNATLAISTIGVKQKEEQFELWLAGMDEMIKSLKPKRIVVYGGEVEYDYKDIEVVYIENATVKRLKQRGRK